MSRIKGNMAENIAIRALVKLGHSIKHTNYYTKWGEIDIITHKRGVIHIIEVKSTFLYTNPAENFSKTKLRRVLKSIQVYCYQNNITDEQIQIDLILVNMQKRRLRIIEHANLYFH